MNKSIAMLVATRAHLVKFGWRNDAQEPWGGSACLINAMWKVKIRREEGEPDHWRVATVALAQAAGLVSSAFLSSWNDKQESVDPVLKVIEKAIFILNDGIA